MPTPTGPTITVVSTLDGKTTITFPADPDPSITHFIVYSSQPTDSPVHFREFRTVVNPLVGIVTVIFTTADAFIQMPSARYFIKVIHKFAGGSRSEPSASPSATITPVGAVGFSFQQLMEQEARPVIIVGFDPVNGLFYPLKVKNNGDSTFTLKVDTAP